jgi:hypothetical protein
MPKTYTPPQPFETEPRPPIALTPIPEDRSHQVAAVGYDDATQTLAMQFRFGLQAIYHTAGVPRAGSDPSYEGLMAAESMGKYHGAHIKPLPFKKYPADTAVAA